MKKNSYYGVAVEDYRYLQFSSKAPYYNNTAVLAQQVAEKALKSVAEYVVASDAESVLKSHNLRMIVKFINDNLPDGIRLNIDPVRASYLKDFYYDAKYPGDNYIDVDKATCQQCLDIMWEILQEVNKFRESQELETVQLPPIMLEQQ